MIITILSIFFLIFLVAIIFYGYGFIVTTNSQGENIEKEKCSLCKENFPKVELILRPVGDSKLFYFCRNCIKSLSHEIKV